ncbi:MAG: fluoride efflux transporter CrcB [Burkholderiales bacterium]
MFQIKNSLLIFLGGGIGCLLRYWISNSMYSLFGRNFPYATLIVNCSGSFLMGLLLSIILEHFPNHVPYLRALLLIGFLGGYTTFSSFSIETLTLIETGEWLYALLNVNLNIILGISIAGLGTLLGRSL